MSACRHSTVFRLADRSTVCVTNWGSDLKLVLRNARHSLLTHYGARASGAVVVEGPLRLNTHWSEDTQVFTVAPPKLR